MPVGWPGVGLRCAGFSHYVVDGVGFRTRAIEHQTSAVGECTRAYYVEVSRARARGYEEGRCALRSRALVPHGRGAGGSKLAGGWKRDLEEARRFDRGLEDGVLDLLLKGVNAG